MIRGTLLLLQLSGQPHWNGQGQPSMRVFLATVLPMGLILFLAAWGTGGVGAEPTVGNENGFGQQGKAATRTVALLVRIIWPKVDRGCQCRREGR